MYKLTEITDLYRLAAGWRHRAAQEYEAALWREKAVAESDAQLRDLQAKYECLKGTLSAGLVELQIAELKKNVKEYEREAPREREKARTSLAEAMKFEQAAEKMRAALGPSPSPTEAELLAINEVTAAVVRRRK